MVVVVGLEGEEERLLSPALKVVLRPADAFKGGSEVEDNPWGCKDGSTCWEKEGGGGNS